VTFEGVARRAKTSKPVLYRRHRSRAHMVVDALLAVPRQPVPACGTPSLREDMLALLDAMMARFHSIGIDTLSGSASAAGSWTSRSLATG
jgi:AcrR family transcriptional regulator